MAILIRRPELTELLPGEYKAVLNVVRLHRTIRGSGPVPPAHSRGSGMNARYRSDFAGLAETLTIIELVPLPRAPRHRTLATF